jgi:hypothetical protein
MSAQVFKICHAYDTAIEKPRFVLSSSDPTRAAVFCQFYAEEAFGPEVSVLNLGIANALVAFYGCEHTEPSPEARKVDMYLERERFCTSGYEALMTDISLSREGLLEILRTHIEGL